MKYKDKFVITLLLMFILFGSINYMGIYIKNGPMLRGGDTGDDDGRITKTANYINNNNKIDTENTNGIPNSWLSITHYPPGYIITLSVISQVTGLNLPLPIPVLNFLFIALMVLFAYITAFYFTEKKSIALVTAFLFVIVRTAPPFMAIQWMTGRVLGFVLAPFLIYIIHKAIFFDKKYIVPAIIMLSSLILTHNSSSLFTLITLFIYFIILLIFYNAKSIKSFFILIVIMLPAYIFTLIYYGMKNNYIILFLDYLFKFRNKLNSLWTDEPLGIILSVLMIVFLIWGVNKIKKIKLGFEHISKKLERLPLILGIVFLLLYFGWIFYKFKSFEFNEVFETLFSRYDFNYRAILNLGIGIVGFAPLGIFYLLKLKVSGYKKIFVFIWFLLPLLNMFRILNLYSGYHKVLTALIYPFVLITAIGLVYFFKRIDKKSVRIIILFLILSLCILPMIQSRIKDNTSSYRYASRDLATKWIDNTLPKGENIIGDIESMHGIELYAKQKPLNNHVFIDGFYKSLEIIRALISDNPGPITGVLSQFDTKYLVINQKKWESSLYQLHDLFNKHPDYTYIYNKQKEIYGDVIKWGISDVGKGLSERFKKDNAYDKLNNIKNLNKIYSNGDSGVYYLNSRKLSEPFKYDSKSNEDGASVTIKNIKVSSKGYLNDDPIRIFLDIENKLASEINLNLSVVIYDQYSNIIIEDSTNINLKKKSVQTEDLVFYISKYDWPGEYTFLFKLFDEDKIYDIQTATQKFEKYPIILLYSKPETNTMIIDAHISPELGKEKEFKKTRQVYFSNILNKTVNFSLEYKLDDSLKHYSLKKRYSLGPLENMEVIYFVTPKKNSVFQQQYTIDSEYGKVSYTDIYTLTINLTRLSEENTTLNEFKIITNDEYSG